MVVVWVRSHLDDLHLLRLPQLLGRLVPRYVRATASPSAAVPRDADPQIDAFSSDWNTTGCHCCWIIVQMPQLSSGADSAPA